MTSEVRRKLTTILAADAEGYSRIMAADEVRGVGALRHARGIFSRLIDRHDGRIANTAGDGLIAEFPSVVEAVQCAVEIQNELAPADHEEGAPLQFRIGIHLGDVILDGEDLLGEGVNLAARLQSMAAPGGILISRPVYDQVHAKLAIGFDYVGERRPKNFSEDVAVYSVTTRANVARVRPRVRVEPAPEHPASPSAEHPAPDETRLQYHGKRIGLLCGGLVAIDLLTGSGFWAHYPLIVGLGVLGWVATPPGGWWGLGLWTTRAMVVTLALMLMNLATWDGTLWVVWPAGVLIMLLLWRRMSRPAG